MEKFGPLFRHTSALAIFVGPDMFGKSRNEFFSIIRISNLIGKSYSTAKVFFDASVNFNFFPIK